MINRQSILSRLETIAAALEKSEAATDSSALLTGRCGLVLFYAYYYRLTGNRHDLEQLGHQLEQVLDGLGAEAPGMGLCNGLSGIAWCLQHLIHMELAEEEDLAPVLEYCDLVLAQYLDEALQNNRYDFLHEGLGTLFYFTSRLPDPGAAAVLQRSVAQLQKAATPMLTGISWRDHFSFSLEEYGDIPCFNLGLAHGVPAILQVLGLIYDAGISKDITGGMIRDGVRWLLSARIPANPFASLYPIHITRENSSKSRQESRLGWCYGDLCVAQAALSAGIRLQDDGLQQAAAAIYDYTLAHRNKENGYIADAGFCHGTSGLAHLYYHAGNITGHTHWLEFAENWLEETMAFGDQKGGAAGYSQHTTEGKKSSYCLLDGIAGIGLVLMAALDRERLSGWERCFLLS